MSTRATIHFQQDGETQAIVYRHSDGYPDGLGKDLVRFFADVGTLADSRFDDPSYLAAKWVVYDAARAAAHRRPHRHRHRPWGVTHGRQQEV